MKRRIIAALVALVLAGGGAVLLISYVNGADQRASERAAAGIATRPVVMAIADIPPHTPVSELAALVTVRAIPEMGVGPGAVSSLDQLAGTVSITQIEAGEQLLRNRFADPKSLPSPGSSEASGGVRIPPGMQQVSVLLEPQRVVGGYLTAGSTVGVFVSAKLALDKVLVVRVQGGVTGLPPASANGVAAPSGEAVPTTPAAVPGGNVMVTFALDQADARTLISGAQQGTIWLALDPVDVR